MLEKEGSVSSVYMQLARIADGSRGNRRSSRFYKLDPQRKKLLKSDLEELNKSSTLSQSTLKNQLCDQYSKIKDKSLLSQSAFLGSPHSLPYNSALQQSSLQ